MLEIAVATMNMNVLNNPALLSTNVTRISIINQGNSRNCLPQLIKNSHIEVHSFDERGLSRSRNRAIQNATETWLIFADDDLTFDQDIEEVFINNVRNDVDIVFFSNSDKTGPHYNKMFSKFKLAFMVTSWTFAVRVDFLRRTKVTFDTQLGLGATFKSTEENSFVLDCFKEGARCQVLERALVTHEGLSTGFNWDAELWKSKGAFFKRNFGLPGILLLLLFIFKKVVQTKQSFFLASKWALKGFLGYGK